MYQAKYVLGCSSFCLELTFRRHGISPPPPLRILREKFVIAVLFTSGLPNTESPAVQASTLFYFDPSRSDPYQSGC